MLYKLVGGFNFWVCEWNPKDFGVNMQLKATENFPVVLFIMLYKLRWLYS